MIIGYNSKEGFVNLPTADSETSHIIYEHFIPPQMGISTNSFTAKKICDKLKAFYSGNKFLVS